MDLNRLRRKRQLNVQERNALERDAILRTARACLRNDPQTRWVRKALSRAGLGGEQGILIHLSAVPSGGGEAIGYAGWLTADRQFFELEASVGLADHALLCLERLENITASVVIARHQRGVQKSPAWLAIEVLEELLGRPH